MALLVRTVCLRIQGSEQSSLNDGVDVSVDSAFMVGAQGTCDVPGSIAIEQTVEWGALVIIPLRGYWA